MRIMKRFKTVFAVSIALVLLGCSGGVTDQQLEEATVFGNAPEILIIDPSSSSGGFADMFNFRVSWAPIDGAFGYQLQVKNGLDDLTWASVVSDLDEPLHQFAAYTSQIIGYEETRTYRVRAVLTEDADSVSPWSPEISVTTPEGNLHYEIFGSAESASVTLRTNTGTEQSEISVPLMSWGSAKNAPMATTPTTVGVWIQATNMSPYISAQAKTEGSISCRITAHGAVISENTSSGRGSVVTCAP